MSTEPSATCGATATAHVSLIVDAETVLSNYPQASQDPDTPTPIAANLLFVLGGSHSGAVQSDSVVLPMGLGLTIHLRARTVALRAEHSVVIYGFTVENGQVLPAPELMINANQTVPAIDIENLTQPVLQQADDHFWCCRPLSRGTEKSQLRLMLVNSQCEAVGYFSWAADVVVE